MRHRHDSERGDKQLHPGEQSSRLPHYAARPDRDLYDGLPLVTDHAWGPARGDDMHSHGYGQDQLGNESSPTKDSKWPDP